MVLWSYRRVRKTETFNYIDGSEKTNETQIKNDCVFSLSCELLALGTIFSF